MHGPDPNPLKRTTWWERLCPIPNASATLAGGRNIRVPCVGDKCMALSVAFSDDGGLFELDV